jgi:hypothetical protein
MQKTHGDEDKGGSQSPDRSVLQKSRLSSIKRQFPTSNSSNPILFALNISSPDRATK